MYVTFNLCFQKVGMTQVDVPKVQLTSSEAIVEVVAPLSEHFFIDDESGSKEDAINQSKGHPIPSVFRKQC